MRPTALRLLKQSTFLTGLVVHTNPLPALSAIYTATLTSLAHLPTSFPYRLATEALTSHRLAVVQDAMTKHGVTADRPEGAHAGQGDEAVKLVEQAIDEGKLQVEQLLDVARAEQALVGRMVDWKAWEPLAHPPPEGQWQAFKSED